VNEDRKGIWVSALRRAVRQPAFVALAGVLLVAAVGLNAATQYMKLYFKKQPVALSRPLETLPEVIRTWVQVSRDEPLDGELEQTLGTDKYVFRQYVNSAALGRSVESIREEVKGKDKKEREELIRSYVRHAPASMISFAVTYYTGMVDTVAHIPDRCYVADGYVPSKYLEEAWPIDPRAGGGTEGVGVRFITFEDQTTNTERLTKNVAYFFHCNGAWESDPLGVRRRLQNLAERYGYYAKVEVMTLLKDQDQSRKVMTEFLASAVPEVEKCLPDWNAVKQQGQNSGAAAGVSPVGVGRAAR